jgi:hypothetical protein
MEKWLREFARDLLALGSLPFFILVAVRIMMLRISYYTIGFISAGILFLILAFALKPDLYSGLGFIMVFSLVPFYNELKFTIFAIIGYILLLGSLFYLGKKRKDVFLGIVLGFISSAIGYWISLGYR